MYSIVYILINALDECADDGLSRNTLVTKLQDILSVQEPDSTSIHLLVTSRSPNNMFSSETRMQIQAAEEDVESFISQRIVQDISKSRSISENIRRNERLKRWIISTVAEKADRM